MSPVAVTSKGRFHHPSVSFDFFQNTSTYLAVCQNGSSSEIRRILCDLMSCGER